jgi:hypothetical protein
MGHTACTEPHCLYKGALHLFLFLPTKRAKQSERLFVKFRKETKVKESDFHTWAVRKVSVHFEYLENRSLGVDETWQPVRGDLTVYP